MTDESTPESCESMRDKIRRIFEENPLQPGQPHACSYLPDRQARDAAFVASQLPPHAFHVLMDLNFRRSGSVLYRPDCETCQQCQAIRVIVDRFAPNRTQRRALQRNSDLSVTLDVPEPTLEKHALFIRYLEARHDRAMGESWEDFTRFLYDSPVRTLETTYRLDDQLLMVAINDIEPEAASTVYAYYDPEMASRSLGVFNVLWMLQWCQRNRIPHLYLGYYIRDCAKMNYKINYRPCEVRSATGEWLRYERRSKGNNLPRNRTESPEKPDDNPPGNPLS